MKITSTHLPPQRGQAVKQKREDNTVKNNKPRSGSAAESVKYRIRACFSSLGLSPDEEFTSFKNKASAAVKHNEIRRVKKTQNLHSIMSLALDVAVSEQTEDKMDTDWFHAFIELAENIYSPEMQELWSKILAVEISRPGTFSLKSLQTLRLITKKEALNFSTACKLASRKTGDPSPRIIMDYHQRKTLSRLFFSSRSQPINLANFGLSYPNLLSLIDLGLIMPSEIEGAEFPQHQTAQFRCGDSTYSLKAKQGGLALVYYKFSMVGSELFLLSKRQEQKDYFQALKRSLSPVFEFKD